jgi:SNF2 family DNA or RNA helicase
MTVTDDIVMGNVRVSHKMPVKIPPYRHQQAAFDYACDLYGVYSGVKKSCGVALLMDMGTGKTAVAIGTIGALHEQGLVNRVLVVTPLSGMDVWKEEFEKFAAYDYHLTLLRGSMQHKIKQINDVVKYELQIIVVNYDVVWQKDVYEALQGYHADLVIADESQKLKNVRAKRSKAMHKIGDQAGYKLILTGTVITNHELDVFSQYRFLNSEIFGCEYSNYIKTYFIEDQYTWVLDDSMRSAFMEHLHSIAFCVKRRSALVCIL